MKTLIKELRPRAAALLAAAAALLLPASLDAAGQLEGYVRDADLGVALEGARVVIPDLNRAAATDRDGFYRLADLPAGTHQVAFQYIGAETRSSTVKVADGETELLSMVLTNQVINLDPYVVTAVSAQARALNLQRASTNLRNVVSSDSVGRFPDGNAAEALNRIPGISVERDQGEGRFVVIRGIDPNLNSIALNGVAVAAPGADERAALLDTIPAEVMERIEVTKAVLPDQPHDSIGGHIDITTPSAFDRGKGIVRATAQTSYSELTEDWGGEFAATWGGRFGKDRDWGLLLSGVWSERTFGSDNVEADPWGEEDGVDPDSGEFLVPDTELQYREYDLTRTRLGLTANLEYKPASGATYYLRASYNEYTDHEYRQLGLFDFDTDDITYTRVRDNEFIAEDVPVAREFKDREETMGITTVTVGGENFVGNWKLEYLLGYSFAQEETPFDFEAIYELDGGAEVAVTDTASYQPRARIVGGDDATDPSAYEFDGIEDAAQTVEETDWSAKFDASYEFGQGALRLVKFGGLARTKKKESELEVYTNDDQPGAIEDYAAFSTFEVRDPFGTGLPQTDRGIRGYFNDNRVAFALERNVEASVFEDYESDEDLFAAYAMATGEVGGVEITGGLRVEHTDFTTNGFRYDADTEVVSPVTGGTDYTNWLPGLHLRKAVNDNLVFRASWNNTLARPTFGQNFPGQIVEEGEEAEIGNPSLQPYESMNWDASVEYYSPGLGLFSAAVFYKDIENFIYAQTIPDGFDADGDGTGETELTNFFNGPSGSILGLELSAQRQLDFLPGPLGGLGVYASLTFTDGEAEVLGEEEGDDNRTLPFLKQSDLIGQFALTYEYNRFSARLAGTYRSEYLDEVGGDFDEDRYQDEHFQLDFTTSVFLTENLSLFADWNNITNEPLRAYWGETRRLGQFEEYGWSAAIGLRWEN